MAIATNRKPSRADAKKALDALIDKAVSDRMKALPRVDPVPTAPPSTKARVGLYVQKAYADGPGANDPRAEDVRKALVHQGATSGKPLHPGEFSRDFVIALQEASILASFAGTTYTNYAGTLAIPKAGAHTVQWLAEGASATPADPTNATVELKDYRAVAATKISGTVLRIPGNVGAEATGASMMASIAAEVDLQLLTGAGTSGAPAGLVGQAKSGNSFALTAAGTTATAAEVDADLRKARQKLRGGKVAFTPKARWLIPSAEFAFLCGLRESGSGSPYFPTLHLEVPRLYGIEVIETEQVTGVVLVEGSHIALGIPYAEPISVRELSDDPLNDLVTCYSRVHCDAKLLHDVALARITGTATKWV